MTAAADRLIVTAVNGGGVLLVGDGRVDLLSTVDTAGAVVDGDRLLLALQSGASNELREIRADGAWRRLVVAPGIQDLHDVVVHDGAVHVASTEHNSVLRLAGNDLEVERRWDLGGERDACHLNALCSHRGRLLASRFGRFDTHRGYKGRTRGAGEIFDVDSGEVVVDGLSQPHSVVSQDGDLWVCDSEAHAVRCFRDGREVASTVLDGYARGLAVVGDTVYAGLSRSRNDPDGLLPHAWLVELDRATLEERRRTALPVDEVYAILPAMLPLESLLRGGIADIRQAAAEAAHARNVAAGEAHALASALAGRDAVVHAANLDMIAARRALADARRASARGAEALAEVGLQLDEEREWARRNRGFAVASAAGAADVAGLPDRGELPVLGLAFAEASAPEVSILVTSHGRFAETAACLRAIAAAGCSVPFEVLLVDDASGDPEMARFARVPGLRYFSNPANLGYLRSVNAAVAHARGRWLHLLNNDTRVQPGWLDALLETTVLFDRFGMAGSMLVHPDGRVQECGGIVWSDGSAMNEGRGDSPLAPANAAVREVDYASAASVLLSRALWTALGGFDERYVPAYYEDTDLAFRVREAGLRVFVQPRSVVEHAEGLSHGTDVSTGGKSSQDRNRGVFRDRWASTLDRDQCAPGELHALARERGQRRRMVLVVDRYAPRPDRDAGSRAIWHLLSVLAAHGYVVKFWSYSGDEVPGYADALRRHGVEFLCTADTGLSLEAWIAANAGLLDTLVVSRPEVARGLLPSLRAHRDLRRVYYGHDLHHVRMARQAAMSGDAGERAQVLAMRNVERDIWRESDLVLYPSDVETGEVARWAASAGARCLARTVPLFAFDGTPTPASTQGRTDVLFVGGFAHAPNADGAEWFAREAWPALAADLPGDTRLVLVGAAPPDGILALAGDRVLVAGAVDEAALHAHYARARAAIVPVRFGAGLKGKIVEALWQGVPCVTTPVGAEGLAWAQPDVIRVGDTPASLAAHLRAVFADDDDWRVRSAAGQAGVAARFSAAALWEALAAVMDDAPYADVAVRRAEIAARAAGD